MRQRPCHRWPIRHPHASSASLARRCGLKQLADRLEGEGLTQGQECRGEWIFTEGPSANPLAAPQFNQYSQSRSASSRPHTVHCGPEGIYVSTLGDAGKDGTEGAPGVFIMDCETFEVLGRVEIDRGPQKLHYDFWWNLPRDYMVSSEWALPPQFENGIVAEDLLANKYGHHLHFWDLRARRNVQTIDLGANHQMALEVRPAHDPAREYGFLGVVVDTTNLEGSIWTWWREDGKFHVEKTATIPAEPAPKEQLPPLLQGFGAVPPLISDIDLSLDDKFLYVACWGTGEMRQYDVSEPRKPKLTGSVRIGGIARRAPHPNGKAFAGGPQMVEISRDGKRVYWTNSLYSTWDNQFYPDGVPCRFTLIAETGRVRHFRALPETRLFSRHPNWDWRPIFVHLKWD